ncbi:hypothetical protein CGMCC3_g12730 [Colletotrichum fructicola]|nr:uncharacterized protein CGMCC3_g12730 [Colletotrichum fructicola]KAE9571154.1 hypothetical protein CGMCC3_g12730 [Colletotrichum fructicola]
MKITVLPIVWLAATAMAQCGVPNGASCTQVGQIACEFNGGHMMYCSENKKWTKGAECTSSGKKCLCGTGTCST